MDRILENIYDMKYSELQKMAKRMGIKANMKIDKLQKAVKDYYLQQDEDSSGITVDSRRTDTKTSPTADMMDAEVCGTLTSKKRVVRMTRKRGGVKNSGKPAKGKNAVLSPEGNKRSSLKATSLSKDSGSRKITPLSTNRASRKITPLSTNRASRKTTPLSTNRASRKTTPQTDGRMSRKVTPHSAVARVQKTDDKAQRSPQRKTPVLQKRKRSLPEQESCSATPSNKRLRRSTCEKSGDMATTPNQSEMSTSPSIQDLIGVMKPDMNSAERKATLLKALDNKVQKAQRGGDKTNSSIPRFVDFLNKKKPITPGNKDWTKIHQKEFERFDSIDVYLTKKRQRTVSITTSVSKVNQVIEKSRQAVSNLKNHKTPNNENKPCIKPSSHTRRANLFKSPSMSKPFQPTTFKTKHMNTNFGVNTQTHPAGHGSVKTATLQVDGAGKMSARKSLGTMATGSAVKSTGVTPFKFSALNTTVADGKSAKKTFDLKASLARPMTWKPHCGKLKPTGDYARVPCVKSPKVATREDRRAAMASHRANKKLQTQMALRGVHV